MVVSGSLKVFVEARKSGGIECLGLLLEPGRELTERKCSFVGTSFSWPDPGLDVGSDGGGVGLSRLKKFEVLLRNGEEGMFCRVSIVRSDSDGRDFRGTWLSMG